MTTTSSAFFNRAHTMNARQAWALMAAGVLGYEVVCKDGELLSLNPPTGLDGLVSGL
jgi:hypothetical protein